MQMDGSGAEFEGNGSGGGWKLPCAEGEEEVRESERDPVFILGFTRRLNRGESDIEDVLRIADELGLSWTIAEDGVIDMFGNCTSDRTMFWEHCIFLFNWK
jgi:hypothetical protein